MAALNLILASSSPTRAKVLQALTLPFQQIAPDIDETAQPDEPPKALVKRLAEQKAQAVSDRLAHSNALIIGSDQVAVMPNGTIVGKPHTIECATRQLRQASGQCIQFHTGLCLLNQQDSHVQTTVVTTAVYFRTLPDTIISQYLQKERPLNCAGSFRSEGLGIALVEKLVGDDPNALIGLPLIALVKMLMNVGIDVTR